MRQNNNGVIYGITYVDHHTKCVFNGSDLGKQYSANAIQQRCNAEQTSIKTTPELKQSSISYKSKQTFEQRQRTSTHVKDKEIPESSALEKSASKLLDDLLQPEENRNANEPFEQKKFKKKKKRIQ